MSQFSAEQFAYGCWRDRASNINGIVVEDLSFAPLRAKIKWVVDCNGTFADSTYVVAKCKELLEQYEKIKSSKKKGDHHA